MSTLPRRSAAPGSAQAPQPRPSALPRPAAGATGRAPAVAALARRDLSRVYPLPGRRREGVVAVSAVSLALEAGSFTSLVGASGCGKSTLLACLAGLDRPTRGSVSVLGRKTTGLGPRAAARLRAEHVGLSAQASQLPHELSGGERQRVAIARVLASRPAVVFADEPTAALDVAAAVLGWLAELAAAGTAVLMVTHDATAAARAERVLVMDAGHLVGHLPGGDPSAVSDAVLAARAGGGR
ncbi:ATP-binding cassette domain-containing protein [Actinomyces sp. 186855]|uniref:ABC transporter ATP-binding protein n=1 Tax=Actinomyces sp. 186855 TaxID=2761164 RepID=UPI002016B57B|nr:ATP-binding cassette domain-containing protein [Actinomyces sp. 186855]MCL3793145.1 ATP-binding cassette domain-containing protein [Actinomyces sp. 186855]